MNEREQAAAVNHPAYETPRMMVCVRPVVLPPELHAEVHEKVARDSERAPMAGAPSAVGARDSYADLREEFAADRDSDPRVEREPV